MMLKGTNDVVMFKLG